MENELLWRLDSKAGRITSNKLIFDVEFRLDRALLSLRTVLFVICE